MKRTAKLIAVLAVVGLFAVGVSEVLAAGSIRAGEGTYVRPRPPIKAPSQPTSQSKGSASSSASKSASVTSFRSGPVAMVGSDLTPGSRGSALVGPTGGAVYSPRQRAEREIRQVIRRLD